MTPEQQLEIELHNIEVQRELARQLKEIILMAEEEGLPRAKLPPKARARLFNR